MKNRYVCRGDIISSCVVSLNAVFVLNCARQITSVFPLINFIIGFLISLLRLNMIAPIAKPELKTSQMIPLKNHRKNKYIQKFGSKDQ